MQRWGISTCALSHTWYVKHGRMSETGQTADDYECDKSRCEALLL